ncbi:hypothetical protein NP233_g13089 [Leucocoprinus birnbaumii]|uniref:Uncharacterized protein n=1 Tax=Leucocoprinus birnbaumii TaxID=56174 RepID=A0AAD5VDA8_9AGAR|nr:hypothetical protein NP233_g13089 [Leucocoprinus birnbaumii]
MARNRTRIELVPVNLFAPLDPADEIVLKEPFSDPWDFGSSPSSKHYRHNQVRKPEPDSDSECFTPPSKRTESPTTFISREVHSDELEADLLLEEALKHSDDDDASPSQVADAGLLALDGDGITDPEPYEPPAPEAVRLRTLQLMGLIPVDEDGPTANECKAWCKDHDIPYFPCYDSESENNSIRNASHKQLIKSNNVAYKKAFLKSRKVHLAQRMRAELKHRTALTVMERVQGRRTKERLQRQTKFRKLQRRAAELKKHQNADKHISIMEIDSKHYTSVDIRAEIEYPSSTLSLRDPSLDGEVRSEFDSHRPSKRIRWSRSNKVQLSFKLAGDPAAALEDIMKAPCPVICHLPECSIWTAEAALLPTTTIVSAEMSLVSPQHSSLRDEGLSAFSINERTSGIEYTIHIADDCKPLESETERPGDLWFSCRNGQVSEAHGVLQRDRRTAKMGCFPGFLWFRSYQNWVPVDRSVPTGDGAVALIEHPKQKTLILDVEHMSWRAKASVRTTKRRRTEREGSTSERRRRIDVTPKEQGGSSSLVVASSRGHAQDRVATKAFTSGPLRVHYIPINENHPLFHGKVHMIFESAFKDSYGEELNYCIGNPYNHWMVPLCIEWQAMYLFDNEIRAVGLGSPEGVFRFKVIAT